MTKFTSFLMRLGATALLLSLVVFLLDWKDLSGLADSQPEDVRNFFKLSFMICESLAFAAVFGFVLHQKSNPLSFIEVATIVAAGVLLVGGLIGLFIGGFYEFWLGDILQFIRMFALVIITGYFGAATTRSGDKKLSALAWGGFVVLLLELSRLILPFVFPVKDESGWYDLRPLAIALLPAALIWAVQLFLFTKTPEPTLEKHRD